MSSDTENHTPEHHDVGTLPTKLFGYDARWCGEHGIGRFAREMLARCSGLQPLPLKGAPSSPLDPLKTAGWLLTHRNSCFFSPGYNAPLFGASRSIFVLHDLNHIDRAESRSLFKSLYYNFIIKRASRRALRVLTVSDFSRRRILDWTGMAPERVVNVGNGVSELFVPRGAADESMNIRRFLKDRCSIDASNDNNEAFQYFLSVSNRRPHKNETGLLTAFARAGLPDWVKLVFTGDVTPELGVLLDELGIGRRVLFTGVVDDDTLAALYRQARGVLFPSFYEGFGLPVVEAMACGTPVMTSLTTSLPEISGDATLLIDPNDTEAMKEAIVRLFNDDDLCHTLKEKGLERAKEFSWAAVATRVESVLLQCLS